MDMLLDAAGAEEEEIVGEDADITEEDGAAARTADEQQPAAGMITPPSGGNNNACRPAPRPPNTATSSAQPRTDSTTERPDNEIIALDDADHTTDRAFLCRVKMALRNHKASWIQTQKRGAEWAFYVPSDPTPDDVDETTYRQGDLRVDCFMCHAAKSGQLHYQFPETHDHNTRIAEECAGFWAPAVARTRDNTEAKHSVLYRSRNGNTSLKKHVTQYHPQEFQQVRLLVRRCCAYISELVLIIDY